MLPEARFPYGRPAAWRSSLAHLLEPPPDIRPSEAAERWRVLHNPGGGYSGPWRNSMAPYLSDPMDSPANPWVNTTVFVGPSQCGKTEIPLNWVHHSITVDPADMLFVLDEKDQADDFSDRRIAKMEEHSPEVRRRVLKPRRYMKTYQGMSLGLVWASGSKAASKPVPRVAITERDLMPDDLDKEGDPVELFRKRTQSFGSNGKILVESSPRRDMEPGDKLPENPHVAPSVKGGIVPLYNTGTRKRWYWQCTHCADWFIPDWELITYPPETTGADELIPIGLFCPHCGGLIEEKEKGELNRGGRWLADGQKIDTAGRIHGAGPPGNIDSYWFSGVASAFLTWRELVVKYVRAMEEKKRTGSTTHLKTWFNTDLGRPYQPTAEEGDQLDPAALKARAVPTMTEKTVPDWVRFLIAAVDVQQTSFKVLIRGYGPQLESTIVDYFPIFSTGGEDPQPIRPAVMAEHWDLLVAKVIAAAWPLSADPGRRLMVKSMAIDLQGESGVTGQAYNFARRCRRAGIADDRVMLVRGRGEEAAPLLTPRAIDLDREGKALPGSLKRYTLNVPMLKDGTVAQLRRTEPGGDMVHIPAWLPDEAIAELAAEKKIEGAWVKTGPNELFDLMGYAHANAHRLQAWRIDWNNPPGWAAPLDRGNSLVIDGEAPPAPLLNPAPVSTRPPAVSSPSGWIGDRGRNWFSKG